MWLLGQRGCCTPIVDWASTVWHSFKYCISEKCNSVSWSMSQTGHVADWMKSRQGKKNHRRSLLDLQLNLQPRETTHLWFTQQYAASFLVPPLQSIFKTSLVIWGKQNSSDIVLAAAPWMMSIILQQMTAIHLRTTLSYLTYPYLADLTLSNANLPLFPLGTGIPPFTPTVY